MENFKKEGDIFKCKLLLEDGTTFIIPMREDGYIYATGLCKVVDKKPNDWLKLKDTKELISKLEKSKGQEASVFQYLEIYKGKSTKYKVGTWIYPDLGIELAKWCSPSFSLQVSKWFRELVVKNKFEIKENNEEFLKIKKQLEEQILINKELNDKYKELIHKNEENLNIIEEKNKYIQILENKFNRIQKRETCPDKNVVYIITSDELEKDGIYMFGKAVDLKIRVGTYNKSLEHKVIHYKSFKNMQQMKTAEMMLLYKKNKYRESKKEKFILPKDKDISLFTNVLDEIYNWFENVENIIINNKESTEEDKILAYKEGKFERNSVYLLTSHIHLEKRTYIIGKSKNLNSRLTAYNKGLNHDVVYTRKCKNINQMGIIELMILYKLDNFRERMNRDRFILPNDKDISFFTNIFDTAVNWFDDVDSSLEIIKDEDTKIQETKESKKIYRENNIEKIKETDKLYREKNKEILLVKQKNYRETNKEKVSNVKKKWYTQNKEKVIERIKNNYHNNKDKKLEKVKEYYLKNKEKIKERTSLSVICECGVEVKKYGLDKHLKTKKHLTIMIQKQNNQI